MVNKDLSLIKKHWESADVVSLKDTNLRALECAAIERALAGRDKARKLADIGCGDGSDTVRWLPFADEVVAFDYSSLMLKKAGNIAQGRFTVSFLDILKEQIPGIYDAVVTKRCLINLGSFENQKLAICKIRDVIEAGGCWMMLECSIDGLNTLNLFRKGMGLAEIREPDHNVYFDILKLRSFLEKYFIIEKEVNFSTYYFLTRVYNQSLDAARYKEFDETARRCHENMDIFGSMAVGPQFLFVLRKKA